MRLAIGPAVLALVLGLAGCAGRPEPPPPPAAAAAAKDVDWTQARPVDVALVDFAFEPERLVLERGRPYLLRLANRGSAGHDFSAPAFFATAALRDDAAGAEARQGAVEVAKGATVDLYLVPEQAGTYPLECTHLLHADIFGMTGAVEVR